MRRPGSGVLFLVFAVCAFGLNAGSEIRTERRVTLSSLDDKELARAASSVMLVRSEVAIGRNGDARIVSDAGSGILVTPCHVMTARHVLGQESSALAPVTRAFTVSVFRPNERAPMRSASEDQTATLVVSGSDRGMRRSELLNDWAFMELEAPVTDRAPLLPFAGNCCSPKKSRIALAGFPVDLYDPEAPAIWIDPDCRVTERLANRILGTDCAATSGNSGGPLLISTSSGWRLGAILTRALGPGEANPGSGQEKFAIPIDAFLKRRIGLLQESCSRRLESAAAG